MQILRVLLAVACVLLSLLALACNASSTPAVDASVGARPPHPRPSDGFDGATAGAGARPSGAGGTSPASAPPEIWENNPPPVPVPDAAAPLPDAGDDDASSDLAPSRDPCGGSVTLVTPADVAAVAQCTLIESLTITGAELETVRLSLLEQVVGEIRIADSHRLARVELPSLRSAGVIDIAGEGALEAIELPALEIAAVVSVGPTRATRLVFPKLRWTDRGLSIRDNPLLTSLELPVFEEIASGWTGANYDPTVGIEIEDNERLASVQLPALQQLDGLLLVKNDPQLSSFALSGLKRAISIELRGTALATFSAPLLASAGGSCGSCSPSGHYLYGSLVVADNPALQSFELPLLTGAGSELEITGNTSLPACAAQMLANQLALQPDHVDLTGNSGTCP